MMRFAWNCVELRGIGLGLSNQDSWLISLIPRNLQTIAGLYERDQLTEYTRDGVCEGLI